MTDINDYQLSGMHAEPKQGVSPKTPTRIPRRKSLPPGFVKPKQRQESWRWGTIALWISALVNGAVTLFSLAAVVGTHADRQWRLPEWFDSAVHGFEIAAAISIFLIWPLSWIPQLACIIGIGTRNLPRGEHWRLAVAFCLNVLPILMFYPLMQLGWLSV